MAKRLLVFSGGTWNEGRDTNVVRLHNVLQARPRAEGLLSAEYAPRRRHEIRGGAPLLQMAARLAINDCTDYNAITCFRKPKEYGMASLTIRNLDESLKADLRLRAARHGCSMEEEARQILRQTLARGTPDGSLARRIHDRFAGLHAESLPIPARKPSRPAPELG